MSDSSPAPRRRGAPLGNRNALKHGFYSRLFSKIDLSDLKKIDVTDRSQDINALRVLVRLTIENAIAHGTPKDLINALFASSHALGTINRLIKSHQTDLANTADAALHQAINEVLSELQASVDPPPSSTDPFS